MTNRERNQVGVVASNLEGLANSSFIWCAHPHGEDAMKRFARALRDNARILKDVTEDKYREQK